MGDGAKEGRKVTPCRALASLMILKLSLCFSKDLYVSYWLVCTKQNQPYVRYGLAAGVSLK